MVGCPHFYLFVSLEGVRSCGARAVVDIGLAGGHAGGLGRGKAFAGKESYGELANKLASSAGVGGRGGGGGDGVGRGGDSFSQA